MSMPLGSPNIVDVDLERMLAVWRQVLGVEKVAPTDDFFHLGGDSLAATTMVVAIEEAFGVILDPIEIFEDPKLPALMGIVRARIAELDEGVL
jgi:acyl carrier protein